MSTSDHVGEHAGEHRIPRRRAWRVLPVLLPLMVVVAASATGCEAIVSSAVPAFSCSDSDPSSCPAGKVCATSTGQCIPAANSCLVNPCAKGLTCDPGTLECVSGVVEAGISDTSTPVDGSMGGKDATPVGDAEVPPYVVGHACAKPSECGSGICADSSILGADYFSKVGAVCTVPCCTSDKCGAGLVCVGAGTGGKYCVPAATLGRMLGAKSGGATCAADADCRAGKCVGDAMGMHKVCADTCCSDATCAGTPADVTQAAKCRPVDVEGNTHKSYACSVLVGGAVNFCGAVDSCISGVCASGSCSAPCCGIATLSGGATTCTAQALSNGDTFNFANGGGTGNGAVGATCKLGTACLSGYCDKADGATASTPGVCSDTCCTDADCSRPYYCRPRPGPLTHFLRCVAP